MLMMQYWKDLVSMAQRILHEQGEYEAVSVIKNGELEVQFNAHDNWNGGIDYWDIVFKLKYRYYTALSDRSELERILDETLSSFHKDESNPIANVLIEPIIERQIDWKAVLPNNKSTTLALIQEERNLLLSIATGKKSFKEDGIEELYSSRHNEIVSIAKRAGFDYPITANSLVEWWVEVKSIATYAERRDYISKLFFPLLTQLQESEEDSGNLDFQPIANKSMAIQKAVEDAEVFIREGKYDSAVDRIHTVFHGYLRQLLSEHSVAFTREDDIRALYSKLHRYYGLRIQPQDVADRVFNLLRSGNGMINAVNELRNNNTIAHPNGALIQRREARLVIDMIHAIITYIEDIEYSLPEETQ